MSYCFTVSLFSPVDLYLHIFPALLSPQSPSGSNSSPLSLPPCFPPTSPPLHRARLSSAERHLYTRGQIPLNFCFTKCQFSPGECYCCALNKRAVFEVTRQQWFGGSCVAQIPHTQRLSTQTHTRTHTYEEDRASLSLCTPQSKQRGSMSGVFAVIFCSLVDLHSKINTRIPF